MSLHTRIMSIAGSFALSAVAAVAQAAPQGQPQEEGMPPGAEACPPGEEAPPPAPPPPQAYEAPPPAPVAPPPRRHNRIFAPGTVSFVTGAGPSDYFGSSINGGRGIDVGAAWDARFTFGTASIIALEAGYIGSTNQVDVVAGDNGRINSNGLDGDLRLQLPFRAQPYIFAGVGWNHMTLDNGNANPQLTRTFRQTDDQVVIPAGAGFTGYVTKHATVDVRGTYRLMPSQDIVIQSDRALHQWMAQARVGYTF